MFRLLLLLALALVALPAAAQSALFVPADDARAHLSSRQAALLTHLESLPTTAETRLVEADLSALEAAAVRFDLPGAGVTLVPDRVERRFDGASYFFRSDDDGTFAIIVEREGGLTGSVRVAGQLYAVRTLTGGLHAVVRVDESRFVDHGPEWDAVEAETAKHWDERGTADYLASAPEGGPVTQSVLVLYTPNADAQAGDIEALIQLAFDETNEGYSRSNVAHRVAPSFVYGTPQNEASFSTTLNRMQNPSDGYHDELFGYRDQYGGDMVQLIAGEAGGLCGTARTILADGPDEAFAVTAQNCATGYYSFGHELGHLQGARHNPETDGSSSPFPYGHGKYHIPGSWRTIMSYACSGGSCTRVLQWSNPDVDYNGTPSGDAALRDNARVLDETAAAVAAFSEEPPVAGVASVSVTRLSGPTVPAGGGPVEFEVTVSNSSGAAFTGDAWIMATLPNGSPYGPIFGPRALTLADGASVTRMLTANVPASAPSGSYTITALAGTYADDVDDSDSFTFAKNAALAGRTPAAMAPWTVTMGALTSTVAPTASATLDTPDVTFGLIGTFPNPFDRTATVHYAISEAGTARVALYDVLGREVAVLADGEHAVGTHEVTLDARRLATGVYLVQVQTAHARAVQRVTRRR